MADSKITKRAMASAFKELMESKPFAKISISDICDKCEMNRKSFYYHFKDKYDLVNWIYYTEFITVAKREEYTEAWGLLEALAAYFYENRGFYRKTMSIEGQNSFTEYYREIIAAIVAKDVAEIFGEDEGSDFYVDFYTDAFVSATRRWMLDRDCYSAEEFTRRLKRCLLGASNRIVQEHSDEML